MFRKGQCCSGTLIYAFRKLYAWAVMACFARICSPDFGLGAIFLLVALARKKVLVQVVVIMRFLSRRGLSFPIFLLDSLIALVACTVAVSGAAWHQAHPPVIFFPFPSFTCLFFCCVRLKMSNLVWSAQGQISAPWPWPSRLPHVPSLFTFELVFTVEDMLTRGIFSHPAADVGDPGNTRCTVSRQ